MTSALVEELISKFEKISLLELKEFKDAFETKFGVTAAAPVAMMAGSPAGGGGAAAAPAEEKTAFDVVLDKVPDATQKINVIKEVRAITGLGLKEAKDLVEGAPKPVKTGVSKDDAAKIKDQLTKAGAAASIK
ncbi:MAG: 50S ribosomal protein L7/L12 [Planctomycetota bacterium]